MSRRRAEDDAERRMKEGRRTRVLAGDTNTVPAPPTHQWSSRGSFSKEKLFTLATKVPPSASRRMGRDRLEMVMQKPQGERLQEWVRLRPERWRELVRVMELKPDYVKVCQEIYEHLRLTYLRSTGRFDGTIGVIEDDIHRRNLVLQRGLETAVEAAEEELRMRQLRLKEYFALQEQGMYINRKGWQHVITPTTTRPIYYIPRDRPMNVPKRKGQHRDAPRERKRPRLDPEQESRKQAILAPTTVTRPDVDPEIPLEEGEHYSCGKVVGAPTTQRMAREALAEHRYRLVVYMSSDEEDDSQITLEPASNVINEEEMSVGVSSGRKRQVRLDDNTEVTIDLPPVAHADSDVDLELSVQPEDEYF